MKINFTGKRIYSFNKSSIIPYETSKTINIKIDLVSEKFISIQFLHL